MAEKTELDMVTRRRAVSFLGLTATLSFALPATVLVVSDAKAQTPGMERREERRDDRQERREERRDDRQERREERRTGGAPPATTGTTTSAPTDNAPTSNK
ncbi:MAG TPA: hypothetical protein VGF53_10010 [Pseudolabrys sp.]